MKNNNLYQFNLSWILTLYMLGIIGCSSVQPSATINPELRIESAFFEYEPEVTSDVHIKYEIKNRTLETICINGGDMYQYGKSGYDYYDEEDGFGPTLVKSIFSLEDAKKEFIILSPGKSFTGEFIGIFAKGFFPTDVNFLNGYNDNPNDFIRTVKLDLFYSACDPELNRYPKIYSFPYVSKDFLPDEWKLVTSDIWEIK